MTIADTIRLLARSRMNEAEIMAALKVEREYIRLAMMRPSRKITRLRFDRVAGSQRSVR